MATVKALINEYASSAIDLPALVSAEHAVSSTRSPRRARWSRSLGHHRHVDAVEND
jgi:hypothetical protein